MQFEIVHVVYKSCGGYLLKHAPNKLDLLGRLTLGFDLHIGLGIRSVDVDYEF